MSSGKSFVLSMGKSREALRLNKGQSFVNQDKVASTCPEDSSHGHQTSLGARPYREPKKRSPSS